MNTYIFELNVQQIWVHKICVWCRLRAKQINNFASIKLNKYELEVSKISLIKIFAFSLFSIFFFDKSHFYYVIYWTYYCNLFKKYHPLRQVFYISTLWKQKTCCIKGCKSSYVIILFIKGKCKYTVVYLGLIVETFVL